MPANRMDRDAFYAAVAPHDDACLRFHSDDPVEAAKFVVSEAVAALWESVLRNDGFAAFAGRVPDPPHRGHRNCGEESGSNPAAPRRR